MTPEPPSRIQIFARFLRFGFLAWGGPVAQIGMLRRELVDEERWIEPARFNRLLAIYQVLPGPEAQEMCVHLGMMRGGRIGGVLAGLGFMLPGFVLILALSWLYAGIDLSRPSFAAIFIGIQIGVVAIIVRAVHYIGKHALDDRWLWTVAAFAAVASEFGLPFWIYLPATGLAYALFAASMKLEGIAVLALSANVGVLMTYAGSASPPLSGAMAEVAPGLVPLFLSGLKAGLLTFGGAYTAIPFVRADAVGHGWITEPQFLNSLALSGIIPAPLIIFATFVGYQAGGLGGAFAITAGIFLPAFSFALLFYDRLERVMQDERLHRLLEGVAAGVVGLIAVTTLDLGMHIARAAPRFVSGLGIFLCGLGVLYYWKSKLSVPAVVLASALGGALLFR